MKGSSTTTYVYTKWDDYKQLTILLNAERNGFSDFEYDANGHVRAVADVKGGRRLTYVTAHDGRILRREETGTAGDRGYRHYQDYYYFDGKVIGDAGKGRPSEHDYIASLQQSRDSYFLQNFDEDDESDAKAASRISKRRINDMRHPVTSADFDQNFMAVNPSASSSGYTVRSEGETVQSIARALYGDSGLWYVIADANGLQPGQTLAVGMTLVIPAVANVRNSASTFKPYSAGEAMGNTMPSLPAVQTNSHQNEFASIVIAIVVIIIAIVVSVVTLGTGASLMAYMVAGALSAAAASASSQVLSKAAGLTDESFSWNAVGKAAVKGGLTGLVTAGLATALEGVGWVDTAAKAMQNPMINAVVTNVSGQAVDIAIGESHQFDWRSVAVSVATAGIGWGLKKMSGPAPASTSSAGGSEVTMSKALGDAVKSLPQTMTTMAIRSAVESAIYRDDQHSFSWSTVSRAAITHNIGSAVGNVAASAATSALFSKVEVKNSTDPLADASRGDILMQEPFFDPLAQGVSSFFGYAADKLSGAFDSLFNDPAEKPVNAIAQTTGERASSNATVNQQNRSQSSDTRARVTVANGMNEDQHLAFNDNGDPLLASDSAEVLDAAYRYNEGRADGNAQRSPNIAEPNLAGVGNIDVAMPTFEIADENAGDWTRFPTVDEMVSESLASDPFLQEMDATITQMRAAEIQLAKQSASDALFSSNESPSGLLDEGLNLLPDALRDSVETRIAIAETGFSLLSGAVATAASGWTMLVSRDVEAGENVREQMTYMPRTEKAQELLGGIGDAITPVNNWLEDKRQALGDWAYEQSGGNALAATGGYMLIDGAATLLPAARAFTNVGKGVVNGAKTIGGSMLDDMLTPRLGPASQRGAIRMDEIFGEGGVAIWLDSAEIRASQRSISYAKFDDEGNLRHTLDDIARGYKENPSDPRLTIDAVRMRDGGLTGVDNSRPAVLNATGGGKIQVRLKEFDEPLTPSEIDRFTASRGNTTRIPSTWGEAAEFRIWEQGNKFAKMYPNGAPVVPKITKAPADSIWSQFSQNPWDR